MLLKKRRADPYGIDREIDIAFVHMSSQLNEGNIHWLSIIRQIIVNETLYSSIVASCKGTPPWLFIRGRCYLRDGDNDRAIIVQPANGLKSIK